VPELINWSSALGAHTGASARLTEPTLVDTRASMTSMVNNDPDLLPAWFVTGGFAPA
jgi:hypothetical protein